MVNREMNKQPRIRKELLIIGITLIIVGWLIGIATPDSLPVSPSVAYQWGLLNIISGVMGLVGWVVVLITGILALVRKPVRTSKCPNCGVIVAESTDSFCRNCGSQLRK